MVMRLYDTAKSAVVSFEPNPTVLMYTCGITPYDATHLGHAATFVAYDVLQRRLIDMGHEVKCVRNVTDVDDPLFAKARELGVHYLDLAAGEEARFEADMRALNVLPVFSAPRASSAISDIRGFIGMVLDRGYAYEAGGSVYFDVSTSPSFGSVSLYSRAEMIAFAKERGGNVDDPYKRNPLDFVLWHPSAADEPSWDSLWGSGRPGWHIECSAMVRQELGEAIDIHLGGADLVFPHHENEIAQSEAVTGQPLAQFWLHNGMVNVGGEKMSKSLGNFTTIRQLLDQGGINPMVLRLFVLQAHYRKPIDFTDDAIASATSGWQTLEDGLTFYDRYGQNWDPELFSLGETAQDAFQCAMDDDLNTPLALAVLFDLAKELRRAGNLIVHEGQSDRSPASLAQYWYTLTTLAGILGLEKRSPSGVNASATQAQDGAVIDLGLSDSAVEDLIAQRQAARNSKNWAEADRLRDELQNQGITLIDQPGGTRWHRS